MRSTDADLLVVGCGPVGTTAALLAAQRGLRVIAVDKASGIYPLPRAIGLDAEGQRLLHTAGLADLLAQCSSPMGGAEFVRTDGKRVIGFDLPDGFVGPLGHPPMVAFDQPALDTGLRTAAVAAGVDLRVDVEVVAIDQDLHDNADRVVSRFADGTKIATRWVLGADGASSAIRSMIDVALDDQGFDQPWLVVDTTLLDDALPLPEQVQQICSPERVVTVVRGHRTRRRWEFQLNAGETRDQMLDPATIESLLSPWGSPDQLRVDRAAVYRFHGLVADRFGVHNVFLAGDAAHQMPPFNGQGMNSGLRDADNLTWKLSAVLFDGADPVLLDSYDEERRPHSVAVVAHSCDAGRLIDAIAAGVDVSTDAGYGGGRPFPHLESGYLEPGHHAVGRPLPQPRVDGVPLDEIIGDGFVILSTHPMAAPSPLQPFKVRNVVLPADILEAIVGPGNAVAVRPDRYVHSVFPPAG